MDIQHLKVFIGVVQQGSFAGAARQLDLTPSAVTRAVAALEATLGARLLQRTTRKVALTEAGAAYLERVRPLVEDLDRAGEELHAHSGQVRGTVRVTASVAYGQTALVPLLPALHAAHPALEVDLLLSDTMLDLVAQRIDVALRLGPAVDSSLIGVQLRPVRFRVCASPAYLRPAAPAGGPGPLRMLALPTAGLPHAVDLPGPGRPRRSRGRARLAGAVDGTGLAPRRA